MTYPQPFSSQRAVPAKHQPGTCPCCGGGVGLKPLFAHADTTDEKGRTIRKQTPEIRTDPETGRPMARYVILCKNDYDALQNHQLATGADAEWKKARKERLATERSTPTPT